MIPYGKHYIDENDIQAVVDVLRSDYLTQGPIVEKFERAVAEYVGVKYAVAVSSGTAALHLANLAADVGPGFSAVTSPITFVASANSILYAGGKVLFADIENDTVNMSPESLEDIFETNKNIKAVIPVHFAGLPCDMSKIKEISDKYGAVIIEDAAHALGAAYSSGKMVGSCENSLMTTFSFHPVKAIASGEGGMITTNDEMIYRKILRLRSHGINKLNDELLNKSQSHTKDIKNPWYYEMQELGFNFRITDIQASLAMSQLSKINNFMRRRSNLASRYDSFFINYSEYFSVQNFNRDLSANHIYVIRLNLSKLKLTRAELMIKLLDQGVGSQVHYLPIPMHPYYSKHGYTMKKFPNSKRYYDECLSIPLYFGLTDAEQQFVISALSKFIEKREE